MNHENQTCASVRSSGGENIDNIDNKLVGILHLLIATKTKQTKMTRMQECMISSPDKWRGSFTWWEAACGQDKITTFQHFLHLFHMTCTLPPATSVAQWCLAMIGCSKCAAISLDSDLRHRAAHDPARSAPLPPPCHSADLRRHLVAARGRRLLGNLEGPRNLKESRDQRIRNNNELDLCVCSWKCVPTWLTLSEHISKHTSLRKFWSLFSTAIVANGYIWKYDLRCAPVCFILFDVPLHLHHSWPAYHPLYRPLCLAAAPLEKVWTSYETQEPALKCSFGDMIRRTRNDSGCIPLHRICLMNLLIFTTVDKTSGSSCLHWVSAKLPWYRHRPQ